MRTDNLDEYQSAEIDITIEAVLKVLTWASEGKREMRLTLCHVGDLEGTADRRASIDIEIAGWSGIHMTLWEGGTIEYTMNVAFPDIHEDGPVLLERSTSLSVVEK